MGIIMILYIAWWLDDNEKYFFSSFLSDAVGFGVGKLMLKHIGVNGMTSFILPINRLFTPAVILHIIFP